MTLRRRLFFVNDDDTVRHIPTTRYDRLWDEPPGRLPEYANQRVRAAEVIVECIQRDPIGMRVHSPHFLRFDSTGAFNKDEMLQQAAKYLDIAHAPRADTAARFMRRRLDHQFRWEVTPLIFGNIADAVFGIGRWHAPAQTHWQREPFLRKIRAECETVMGAKVASISTKKKRKPKSPAHRRSTASSSSHARRHRE